MYLYDVVLVWDESGGEDTVFQRTNYVFSDTMVMALNKLLNVWGSLLVLILCLTYLLFFYL